MHLNQARIPFQWDMENGEIHFRVRNRCFARKGCAAIGPLFQFSLEDSSGATFGNLFTAAGLDEVTQVIISLPKAGEGPRDAYLAYVWGEAVHWLHRLPKRSSAALEDIPKLDFGAIWTSIFESHRRDEGVPDAACTAGPTDRVIEP